MKVWRSLSFLLVSTAPVAVLAQEQPLSSHASSSTGEGSATPPGGALVDDSEGANDIIVTAQKRAERIQDVPIAITVVDGEMLNRSGAKNLTELQGLAPGFFVSGNSGHGGAPLSIRGTSGANSLMLDDPVAVYVNGVYQSSGTFGGTSFLDIGSIEVVRGPQGTLQGRNATAGAVLVRSAGPTGDFGGYARISLADPLEARAEAALGGPITDTLGIRVAGNLFHERGWASNNFDGGHLGGGHGYAARVTLRWRPTSDLDIRFIAGRTLTYAEPAVVRWAATPINPSSSGPLILPGTATPTTPLTAGQRKSIVQGNNFALNRPTYNRITDNALTLDATYSFGAVDLYSITGYNKIGNVGALDSDGFARTDREGFNMARSPTENFSQEIRLQSSGKQKFNWIVGGYYSSSKQEFASSVNNLQLSVPDRRATRFLASQKTKSYAIFADGTFQITPELAVIGGVRYTRETKDFRLDRSINNYDTGVALLPQLQYRPSQAVFTNTSYRAKITYQPIDNVLIYASYSTGFKGGGFNAFGDDPAFQPEKLKSAEAGVKADLLDRLATVSLAVYTNRYNNLQVRAGVPAGGIAITNAANSKIDGFELEGTLRPTPTLSFLGNVSYTNARFTSFPLARNLLDQGPFDASGNKLPRTPAWQFYASASWTPRLSATIDALFEPTARYRSRVYYYQTDQQSPTIQGGPLLEIGVRAGVNFVPQQLTATIFATNLNNDRSVSNVNIAFSYPAVTFNRPRVIGLQIEKKF